MLLFCLLPVLSFGQNWFEGRIYADSIDTYQVNIINIDQKSGVVSNSKGEFKIKAEVGDSILFTSLQHKTQTLKIKDSQLKNKNSIFLELQVNELPEVTINQYDLTGDLNQDVDQVKVLFVDQRQFGFGIPRKLDKIDREIYTANSSSGGIPLAPIINAITGETKRLKKRKNNAIVSSNQRQILRKGSIQLITEDLNIPEQYIEDFANYCAENADFISVMRQDNPLTLIDELKKMALAYLKLKFPKR